MIKSMRCCCSECASHVCLNVFTYLLIAARVKEISKRRQPLSSVKLSLLAAAADFSTIGRCVSHPTFWKLPMFLSPWYRICLSRLVVNPELIGQHVVSIFTLPLSPHLSKHASVRRDSNKRAVKKRLGDCCC